MAWKYDLRILDATNNEVKVAIGPGDVTLLAGPNGVGKSALLYSFFRSHDSTEQAIELLPGHRQIHFQNENIDYIEQSPERLAMNMKQSIDGFSRIRGAFGETHLKSNVKRIATKEADLNSIIARKVRSAEDARSFAAQNPSLISALNRLFALGKIPVSLEIYGGVLRVTRSGAPYGVDKMSDGERAALLLAGSILAQEKNAILLVDEPEKHLHPSISGPLISAAIRSRSDLSYVFATHDLSLVEWLSPATIIHVRDSHVISDPPEHRTYDFALIRPEEGISDDLKAAILGARKTVLFVEGAQTSNDRALYSLIYPGWNIIPRGGWEDVTRSVHGLRENKSLVWLTVYGLIDGDGREADERQKLAAKGIFCVTGHTVENLFLVPEVLTTMADTLHRFKGGQSASERIGAAQQIIPELVRDNLDEIVFRKSVWVANRLLSERKVSVKQLADGRRRIEGFDIEPIIQNERSKLADITRRYSGIMLPSRLPVKNTSIPAKLVSAMGYANFDEYKEAVLKRLEQGDYRAKRMIVAMRKRLAKLPKA